MTWPALTQSNQRAMDWFKRATDKDYAIAQHELATFYYAGLRS